MGIQLQSTKAAIFEKIKEGRKIGCVPAAMASPITPTIGTSPTITGRLYAYNSSAFNLLGATWYMDVGNSRTTPVTADKAGDGLAYANGANRVSFSGNLLFNTDSQTLEIDLIYAALRVLVLNKVTGQWEVACTVTGGDSSTRKYVLLDFGSALVGGRTVKIESNDVSFKIFNLRVPAIYTIWPAAPRVPLRGIVIGDSYPGGTGLPTVPSPVVTVDGCFQQLGYLMGIDDWRCSSSGGTGFVAVNGAAVNYLNRFQVDVINQGPFDIVLIEGSGNDFAQTLSQVTANLTAMLAMLDASMPGALVIVTGSWTVKTNDTVHNPVTTAIQAALVTRPDVVFMDMSTWITGTGNVGATVGDGNADRYVNADGIHPAGLAGHSYRAANLAQGIDAMVQARMSRT